MAAVVALQRSRRRRLDQVQVLDTGGRREEIAAVY